MEWFGHLILLATCLSVTNSSFLLNVFPKQSTDMKKSISNEEMMLDKLKDILYRRNKNEEKYVYDKNVTSDQGMKSENVRVGWRAYSQGAVNKDNNKNTIMKLGQRRANDRKKNSRESVSSISSSSFEFKQTKEEMREDWLHKKLDALNDTLFKGDTVNVLAARPWGVSCGDPNQYDLPWGQCMLETECEPEFRIYRGDQACGRTLFVCCALKVDSYDMNQPFDLSLVKRSSEASNTDEKEDRNKGSREQRKRQEKRQKRKRKKLRYLQKRKIQKELKKIIRAVSDILETQTRNSSKQRSRQTKALKNLISNMKKQFRQDRKKLAAMEQEYSIKASNKLMQTLSQMKTINEQFVSNMTFREIVVNGTAMKTKEAFRMFVEANPQIKEFILHRHDNNSTRRLEGDSHSIRNHKPVRATNKFIDIQKHLYRRMLDRKKDSQLSDISSSSSVEARDWKQEVREKWLHKKFEAFNGSRSMEYWPINGPWGTVCGDPNQMDVPWGQCLPEPECDSEFRIYRGDYACGRSLFVCCAIKGNMEDMNRGLDLSLIDSLEASASVDKITNDREKRKRREARDKKKRTKLRILQKKKFKHSIKLVTKEVAELLAKQSRNSTRLIRKKVKALKAILKGLKQQFRTDRQKILNDMQNRLTVDNSLIKQLNEMKEMNEQFVSNMTFRDIVVNGRVSNKALQMLLRAYPELYNETARRSAGGSFLLPQNQDSVSREYYIEYGYLYY